MCSENVLAKIHNKICKKNDKPKTQIFVYLMRGEDKRYTVLFPENSPEPCHQIPNHL